MSLKVVVACIALVYATPFPSHAQGGPKGDCIDTAEIGGQQIVNWDTVDTPRVQAFTTTESQAYQQAVAYRTYLALGGSCETHHRFTDAEQYYQSAYALAKSAFGERNDLVLRALYGIATTRLDLGRVREADVSFHQILNILESDKNADPLEIGAVLNSLAVVQQMSGNFSSAAALIRKVVHIVETKAAADAVELGVALSNLAVMLRHVGSRLEAVNAAERAGSILECCKKTYNFAANLVIRGLLHLDEGDLAVGEAMFLRALNIAEDWSNDGSPAQATILTHLGALYTHNGRHKEAEPYFQRALEINRRLLTPDHPALLDSMGAYAALLRATRRKSEAKKLEAYIEEHRKKYNAENPAVANVVDVHSLMKHSGH
jgi:tetratricopeptide (TPR) repeat protein